MVQGSYSGSGLAARYDPRDTRLGSVLPDYAEDDDGGLLRSKYERTLTDLDQVELQFWTFLLNVSKFCSVLKITKLRNSSLSLLLSA